MTTASKLIATPPGKIIEERIRRKNLTLSQFQSQMHLTDKELTRLLSGQTRITPNLALELEKTLDIPAAFLCNLEHNYREKLKKINEGR